MTSPQDAPGTGDDLVGGRWGVTIEPPAGGRSFYRIVFSGIDQAGGLRGSWVTLEDRRELFRFGWTFIRASVSRRRRRS